MNPFIYAAILRREYVKIFREPLFNLLTPSKLILMMHTILHSLRVYSEVIAITTKLLNEYIYIAFSINEDKIHLFIDSLNI